MIFTVSEENSGCQDFHQDSQSGNVLSMLIPLKAPYGLDIIEDWKPYRVLLDEGEALIFTNGYHRGTDLGLHPRLFVRFEFDSRNNSNKDVS